MLDKLTDWACELDRFLRRRDFAIGRTADGYLDRRFGIRRHTVAALLWPAALVFFAVMATANPRRSVWAAAVGTNRLPCSGEGVGAQHPEQGVSPLGPGAGIGSRFVSRHRDGLICAETV